MKRNSFLLFLVACLFLSCSNEFFLPNPSIYPQTDDSKVAGDAWHAPKELKSTQGIKRLVTLTWQPVEDAIRYNIYRAESEFDNFIQVGETKDGKCEFVIKTEPGFDMYYRVTAVDVSNNESEMSNIERATTLSKPIINSIEGAQENSDSSVYVSWYMNNYEAYMEDVFYNITCFDENNKEVQSQQSKGKETTVLFTGLEPNTNYLYKVEAYNKAGEYEESEIVDAATARRLRPDPATELTVTQGISKDSISLSFVLPKAVDIATGKNQYEQVPVYFKIYRRVYKEGENKESFKLVKDDFGVNRVNGKIDYSKVKFGDAAEDYVQGNVVTYIDKDSQLKRGEKYEYKVQSFAYYNTKQDISSDESIVQTEQPGWLLPEYSFEVVNFIYEKNPEGVKTKASLNFKLSMETYGIPYKYKIVEIKRAIKGDTAPEPKDLTEKDSVAGVNSYIKEFKDLTAETGYYRYQVVVLAPDGTTALDAPCEAVGESLVTAEEIPRIGDITITYGYADKVELKWQEDPAYTYTLKYWDDGVPGEPIVIGKPAAKGEKIYTDTTVTPGVVRTYQLVVNNSQFDVPSKIMEATVPVKPDLSSNYAYDRVSVVVNNSDIANKESYKAEASFEDSSLNNTYELKPVESVARNAIIPERGVSPVLFDFEIVKKDKTDKAGTIDAAVAGAKVNISITESHPLTIRTYKNEVESDKDSSVVLSELLPFTDVPGEIQTLNSSIVTAYVGPALLNQTASQGTNADNITVTWDKVLGADSYVVFRDRYHLGRSGDKNDLELQNSMSDKYIVTLNEDGTVSVKCDDAELDPSELGKYVSAIYSAETNKFTLTDKYREKASTDTGNQWRTGQAEITWGAPNKYTVMPVLSETDGNNSSKDKDIVSISKLKIENVKNVLGGTKGYGWNVTATQGTYSSGTSTGSSSEKVNDAIEVKWTEPYFGKNDRRYAIFRKEAFNDIAGWKKITVTTSAGASYIDSNNIEQGMVYEYAIVEKDSNTKSPDINFITKQNLGENGTILNNSKGFILPKPEISAVSREDLSVRDKKPELKYCEEVVFITDVNINGMINGYVIQVRNNNIDNQWHDIKDVPITKDNKNSDTFIEIVDNLDLLKVLRDYKHYYRIRAYTIVGGEKIYSKPDDKAYDAENNPYVKWGCRQISNKEFARTALIGMSLGMEKERGTNGTGEKGIGIPGLQSTAYDQGWFNYKLHIDFTNYDTGVVIINGKLIADGLQKNYPYHYNSSNVLEVTYNGIKGTIQIKGDVSRDQGTIVVNFNGENISYNMGKGELGYLPFPVNGKKPDYLNNNPEWQ